MTRDCAALTVRLSPLFIFLLSSLSWVAGCRSQQGKAGEDRSEGGGPVEVGLKGGLCGRVVGQVGDWIKGDFRWWLGGSVGGG